MADYQIRISISGDVQLLRHIATAKTALSDFSPLWKEVEDRFLKMEAVQFATEGHGQWPALAESTVAHRGSAHPILVVTGDLFRSLTGGAGYFTEKTPFSIKLGSSLTTKGGKWNLGLLHQTGTGRSVRATSKSGKALKHPKVSFRMPPRKPIDPAWEDRIYLRALFAAYIHLHVTGEKGPTQ